MIKLGYLAKRSDERGVVSLLTVIFFMVFISLIVLGFITLVVADQRQTIDNDLSSSALAAAHSGIEDGKRILIYCLANPSASGCDAALNSQNNCNAFNPSTPAYALATNTLRIPIGANGEGATGGASAYQQYFTCLTIQTKTPSLSATLSSDSDYIQRIKTDPADGVFTQLKITWSGEGTYANRAGGIFGWPTLSNWVNGGSDYMPVIRFQTIPYVDVSNLNAIESATRTVFIVPCGSLCPAASKNINALDIRNDVASASAGLRATNQPPITYANCSTLGASYSCTVTLSGYNSTAWQYYIRASVLYANSTTMTLSALDSSGSVIDFDNVQPWIDVTGRTDDVFKRVRAEVSYQPTAPLPTNALDSAAPICKKLTVTNSASSSSYNCN